MDRHPVRVFPIEVDQSNERAPLVGADRRGLRDTAHLPFGGQVFSIDPAMTGYENFTAFLPSELDDLENEVKQGNGMVQKFPPAPAPRPAARKR